MKYIIQLADGDDKGCYIHNFTKYGFVLTDRQNLAGKYNKKIAQQRIDNFKMNVILILSE